MDIPDSVREDLEACSNVVGTAVGPKRVDGQPTDEEVIVVLVSQKLPEVQLAESDRIPKTIDFDDTRVKTDVQEVGDLRPQATTDDSGSLPDRERRWRPVPAGVSFGHNDISAGTLGSPPLETEDGTTVVLTNAHVAAPVGIAEPDDAIYQPGPADGGTEDDVVGTLVEGSEIAPNEPNTTDSAIVEVDPETFESTILGIGEFAGFADPEPDATYTKSGRTTGVTTGDLRGRDARIKVRGYHDEPTTFEGIDVFGPMSAAGDSGSLIGIERDEGFYATDLLFAGSDRTTLAIPMDAVEAEHGALEPLQEESTPGSEAQAPAGD